MKKRALLFALFYISYLYYAQPVPAPGKQQELAPASFHPPLLIHKSVPNSYLFVNHDFLEPGGSVYLGKYKRCDSLRLPDDIWNNSIHTEDIVYDFIWNGKSDKFKTDGFQLVPDYRSTIFYSEEPPNTREGEIMFSYYPVYAVNETSEIKYFIFKRHYVFAIQEAMELYSNDKDGWWPIEYNDEDWSGDGFCAIKVHPGEFILFMMPRYMGGALTKMRVRLQNGDNIIVSNSFNGYFHPSQFQSDPEGAVHGVIDRNDIHSIQSLFLGALPKELELGRS